MTVLRSILAVLVGLVLLLFSAMTAAWNIGRSGQLGFLPEIARGADYPFARAMDLFRNTAMAPDGTLARMVEQATRLEPLAAEPLLFAALRAKGSTTQGEAIWMLEEARRRNPRSKEVRIVLLDRYLRAGKFGESTREIAVLNGLIPEDREKLASILTYLVAMPESRHATIAALRESPLRKGLMASLAASGASSYLLTDISPDLTGMEADSPDAAWASAVVGSLARSGDLSGAQRLWKHLFATDRIQLGSGVVDGRFAGTASGPFGWSLSSNEQGRAFFTGPGLRVRYPGKDSTLLARQLLVLQPGSYRLTYQARPRDGRMPSLAWRIDCVGSGATLLSLPFVTEYSFESITANTFQVPAEGCEGQWLSLAGRPSQVPAMGSADIAGVAISREDAK